MRTFTEFSARDPQAKELIEQLLALKNDVPQYRENMNKIGSHLAMCLLPMLSAMASSQICVVCTVEDADFLAKGLVDKLEAAGMGDQVHLLCLWNKRIQGENVSISPITREYFEELDKARNTVFIVVKSIISGACVVKTNLTRAISYAAPEKIIVAAPVMLSGAEKKLEGEFPKAIRDRFEFVSFVTDTEKDGDNVVPGVGGSIYELLGLGNSDEKNRYVPTIVKDRRQRRFSGLAIV